MLKRILCFNLPIAIILLAISSSTNFPASISISAIAAETPIDNYSFEDGITSWTPNGGAGVSSTTNAYTGTKSLLYNDTSSTTTYEMMSNKVNIPSSTVMKASAMVYLSGTNPSVNIGIYYYNSSNANVGTASSATITTKDAWVPIFFKSTSPATAVKALVVVRSLAASVGNVYYDDVGITTAGATNLGTQINSNASFASLFGKEGNTHVMYTVLNGIPSKFCVVDISAATPAIIRSYDINYTNPASGTSSASWGITSTDGKVYLSTAPYAGNTHMFKYDPSDLSFTDLGIPITNASIGWDICAGATGTVYGGTSANTWAYKYNPSTGFTTMQLPSPTPNASVVRSIAYGSSLNVLYAGVGSPAKIYRFDLTAGTAPTQVYSSTEKYVDEMNVIGGSKLFTRLSSGVLKVYYESSGNLINCMTDSSASKGITKHLYGDGSYYYAYYTKNISGANVLRRYKSSDNSVISVTNAGVNVELPFEPFEMDVVDIDNNGSLDTIVASGYIGGKLKVCKYTVANSNISSYDINTTGYEAPTLLRSIESGPNGYIYTGGYLTGGFGRYTSLQNAKSEFKGIDQIDTMLSVGNDLYLGVYPSAKIYKYDKSQSWTLDSGGSNPQLLFSLSSSYQHRVYAMAYTNNKLFVGTVPNDEIVGGALTIYDGTTPTVYRSDAPLNSNQSVISLAVGTDGKVYGGTSIAGGMNATPTATACKFFKVDPTTNVITDIALPATINSKKAITALAVGPDGYLWGLCEGYLFTYNTATGTFPYCSNMFTDITYTNAPWRDASLVKGADNNMYVTFATKGYLSKITSAKVKTELLSYTNYCSGLTKDIFDNLYYFSITNLFRYVY